MSPAVRILLVEDEPQLVNLIKRYLGRVGYEVDLASSTEDAAARIGVHPGGYQVVLADLSMAGVEGVAAMLAADPGLRVALTSGYPFDTGAMDPADAARTAFLHKPFTSEMLLQTVQDLLAR